MNFLLLLHEVIKLNMGGGVCPSVGCQLAKLFGVSTTVVSCRVPPYLWGERWATFMHFKSLKAITARKVNVRFFFFNVAVVWRRHQKMKWDKRGKCQSGQQPESGNDTTLTFFYLFYWIPKNHMSKESRSCTCDMAELKTWVRLPNWFFFWTIWKFFVGWGDRLFYF